MTIPIDPSLQTDKLLFAHLKKMISTSFLNWHRMKMHGNTSHVILLTKITREVMKQTIFGDIEEEHANS
jgi:hypothetical protein